MAGIFKAYDVRGVYPTEIDEAIARQIGLAFQFVLDDEDRAHGNDGGGEPRHAVHSEGLAQALIEGLTAAGLDVLDIGLATTPMNYFAVGHLGAAGGIQVTASHNPARYNGFKFSRHGARPVSGDHGIPLMEKKVAAGELPRAARPGTVRRGEIFAAYRRARPLLPRPAAGRTAARGGDRRRQRHGHPLPADPRRDGVRPDPALLRARRHLPQPRAQPAQGREPPRPPGRGPPPGRRPRGGLRRRRRPRRLHRRAGRGDRQRPDDRR